MPFPAGTFPIGGPILDGSTADLTPTLGLHNLGVVSVRGGKLRHVNSTGAAWVDVPGHHIGTAEPPVADRFLGQLWLDTSSPNNLSLKAWDGTAYVEISGGAGIAAGTAYAFTATLADIADISSGTAFANFTSGLTAGELINTGNGFTVETASSRDKLVITNGGVYSVTASLIGDAEAVTTGNDRGGLRIRLVRTRGGVATALAPEGTPTYSRNLYEDFSQRLGSVIASIYEFEAGDKIEIQGVYEVQGTSVTGFNLSGARSGIAIASQGAGPQGIQGPPGTGAVTNLDIDNRGADSLDITSDTGTDVTVPSATAAAAGLESAADKTKLDGIADGATVGGESTPLSDDDPFSVGYSPSAGGGLEAARDTHRHALTHRDRGRVDSVDGLKAVTHDLTQTNVARSWVTSGTAGYALFDGEPTESELTGAAYTNVTITGAQFDYIGVRVIANDDPRDYRAMLVLGGQTQIQGLAGQFHYHSTSGGFDYYEAFLFVADVTTVTIQYHELPGGTSHYRGEVEAAKVPIDNTLQVNSSDEMGVNISSVVETLQENVRYWSLANNFETSSYATKGMYYDTSPLRKIITKVRVSWRNNDNYIAKIGLYRLDPDDDNRILEVLYFGGFATDNPGYDGEVFHFTDATDGRIVIPAGIRLGIALSRNDNHAHSLDIQHGFENANSPDESYSDASADFDYMGTCRLAQVEPDTSHSLSHHNDEVWGNIHIYYTVAVSHASLLGDDNVNIDHISSGTATEDKFIGSDGAGGSIWKVPPAGSEGTPLTPAQVIDETSEVFGTVSGERLSEAVAAFESEGGGGGVGSAETDLFVAPIESQSSVGISGVYENELSLLDTNVRINRGEYAIVAGTNSQQAVELPADGTYTISGTIRAEFSTSSEQRNYLQWSIVVLRGPNVHRIVPASVYTRSALLFETYTPFTYTDDFESGDRIELRVLEVMTDSGTYHIGGENSFISILREAGGGASGQESPGSGFGGELIILYQRVADDTRPADPVAPYSNGDYVTDFGDWVDDIADLTGTGFDWVATGGTAIDADGAIVSRTWALQAYIAVQYAEIVQDNSTYTDVASTASRFVRHRLTDGTWGPWVPLSLTDWVPIVSDINAYVADTDDTESTGTLNFDATYFNEMRVTAYTFGRFVNSVPSRLGVRGSAVITRRGSTWTVLDSSTSSQGYGSYKVRLDDKVGLQLTQLHGWARDDLTSDLNNNDDDFPDYRANFRMDLVGRTIINTLQPNTIGHITFRNHPPRLQ